jgi:hypothetical protein
MTAKHMNFFSKRTNNLAIIADRILFMTDLMEDQIVILSETKILNLCCTSLAIVVLMIGIIALCMGKGIIGYLLILSLFPLYTLVFRALVPARAMRRLVRKSDRGDLNAILEMGRVYEFGNSEIPRERSTAQAWYRRAAQRGHIEAAYHLAELLRQDSSNEEIKREAQGWYHFAAEYGHFKAAAWLAWSYKVGDGIEINNSLAEKFQTLANLSNEENSCKL